LGSGPKEISERTERLNGRVPAVKAIESKYLLTGFAQCAVCGGSLMARSRDYGSARKFGYLCGYHHQRIARSSAICSDRESSSELSSLRSTS